MEIKTFGDLIDWTRQLHAHLAKCLTHCTSQHEAATNRENAQCLTPQSI